MNIPSLILSAIPGGKGYNLTLLVRKHIQEITQPEVVGSESLVQLSMWVKLVFFPLTWSSLHKASGSSKQDTDHQLLKK